MSWFWALRSCVPVCLCLPTYRGAGRQMWAILRQGHEALFWVLCNNLSARRLAC